ncbi:AglZ/HisF2 family acetamidino modification protein [Algoriphagus sp.]|uniref:AglZ/HisF2 family acetamidino modification protein n=1 Tax=Algoriphagus sp. TaxID=1872435 RepID=UPI0027229E3A|nr:AglZ/HisF2 family acetamidino modification protein [Algoriphagus sp.]MDO8965695.1 AglZ/HisF2 family acetamidino modification protein [Algoriphagus sp.]MDP3202388.1 AglZ/HisF2 family acetamidino modification protein [Algoriphagus sp.]
MLRSRIIPCLLVHKKGLVKTVNFKDPKYVGDPINAVKIFNEKEVDELMVLDIDATVENRGPNFEMIRNLAQECRMPFCYGGGVTTVEQAKRIIELGAEKVALSTSAVKNPLLLSEIGKAVGSQSVVVVIDVRKKGILSGGGYDVYIKNGKEKTGIKLKEFIQELNKIGVGEIVINSIDKDGTMSGYDLPLISTIRELTDFPMTVLGGAGNLEDIKFLISKFKIIGAAAGSLFVFKGKYKAVLINYPNREEKSRLFKEIQ